MRVLALDTTTREGSVALVIDDHIVDERGGDRSRSQAERLPGDVLAVIEARGLSVADIDLFAVAAGPGSFTGLRIGIATMQGLAFASGRPIVGVSALDALAAIGGADGAEGDLVAAWIDAHRGDVYSALYRIGSAFTPTVVEGATVGSPDATLARWRESTIAPRGAAVAFLGDGATRYGDLIDRSGVGRGRREPRLAGMVGRLAEMMARRGEAAGPEGVHPFYVRRPDVEIARDRKALPGDG